MRSVSLEKATGMLIEMQFGDGDLDTLRNNALKYGYTEDQLELRLASDAEWEQIIKDQSPLDDVKNKKIEEALHLAREILENEFDSIEVMIRLGKGIPDPTDPSFVELKERYINIRNQYQAHRTGIEALPKEGIENYVISYT